MRRTLLLAAASVLVVAVAAGSVHDVIGAGSYTPVLSLRPLQRVVSDVLNCTARSAVPKPSGQTLAELREENDWKNDLVLRALPGDLRARIPRVVQTWLRCWLMCMALYFGIGAAWCYYTYFCFGSKLYKPGTIPSLRDCLEQMAVSFRAMPLYSLLPVATEYCVEQGWTLAYSRISDVGLGRYLAFFLLYMASVEFFVYWQHRMLHSGWGYSKLHVIHHKYNKEHSLGPFSGLAFHPLDGIMQAIPYSWTLFYVPMHFLTHELLLFTTAIWTTNIHDNLHAKIPPVMGAGYHTIHHTRYNYNYGHYFTFVDALFGTLLTPEQESEMQRQRQARAAEAQAAALRAHTQACRASALGA